MNLFPSFVVDKRRFYSKNSTHLFLIIPNNNGNRIRVNRNSVQIMLIGLCLGITLGVALIPLFDTECFEFPLGKDFINSNLPAAAPVNSFLSVEDDNHQNPNNQISIGPKTMQNMRRPRFYTTELGLRQKLLIAIIITDYSKLENLIAINKTVNGFVNQVLFFTIGQRETQEVKRRGISTVVTLASRRNGNVSYENLGSKLQLDQEKLNKVTLRAIKYIGDKLASSYDFFFLTLDKMYIDAKTLLKSIEHISISQDVFWGFSDGNGMCQLESGFVLSRSIIRKLSSRLDRCSSSLFKDKGNTLEKCLQFALGNLECSRIVQGQHYLISTGVEGENVSQLSSVISIGPVSSTTEIYKIHLQVSENRAVKIDKEMKNLVGIIERMVRHIPQGYRTTTSWPVGLPVSHASKSRFDVLKWKFFTLNKIYPRNEHETEMSIDGIEKLDLISVVNISSIYLRDAIGKESFEFEFKYGYRRIDETRGMEYVLHYNDNRGGLHRIECVRPLLKLEMVPMPFVTETRRVTIVMSVELNQYKEIDSFLTNYLDFSAVKKLNTVLIFAIVIKNSVFSSEELIQFQNLKRMISEHNTHHTNVSSMNDETPESIKVGHVVVNTKQFKTSCNIFAVFDMLSSRILSPNALVLALDNFIELTEEFLNRVRMNTILNFQVFSPIMFYEYNPKIPEFPLQRNKQLEINKLTGYFESKSFAVISFYIGDYMAARKQTSQSGSSNNFHRGVDNLSQLFLQGSQLHILRSPEPSLKFRFDSKIFLNCSINNDCFEQNWGSKLQLAKMILKYRNIKK